MNFAIIVAAGKGTRMKKDVNKVFLPILGKPLIYYSIKPFQDCSLIDGIIIVAQKNDFEKIREIKEKYAFNKIRDIVEGGTERQDSVYNGLKSLNNAKKEDIILVHNGSNPLIKENEIIGCIDSAKKYGCAAAAFPLKDTIKKISNGIVEKTVDRNGIYQMQTPQAAKYSIFNEAFAKELKVTDDVSLVESIGKKVKIVECSYENIKVTTEDDLVIAEGILMKRQGTNFRIGFGQDSHRFSRDKNKKLALGGFAIPNEIGLEANSDGDLILHALFNALSSTIGDRSLGFYADKMFKENKVTDSKQYLKIILKKLEEDKLEINNVSISIEASKPKLEKYTDEIKQSLSKILDISKDKIGLTYTSGEGLTEFGKGNGMQCFVVVSLLI